eukprot:6132455-Prymnesium_polylepis.1
MRCQRPQHYKYVPSTPGRGGQRGTTPNAHARPRGRASCISCHEKGESRPPPGGPAAPRPRRAPPVHRHRHGADATAPEGTNVLPLKR